jgi:hypothetical protein
MLAQRIAPQFRLAAVAVAVTARDVWTVDGAEHFVRRVNTAMNREVNQVPVGNQPVAVASGAGAVGRQPGGQQRDPDRRRKRPGH